LRKVADLFIARVNNQSLLPHAVFSAKWWPTNWSEQSRLAYDTGWREVDKWEEGP